MNLDGMRWTAKSCLKNRIQVFWMRGRTLDQMIQDDSTGDIQHIHTR